MDNLDPLTREQTLAIATATGKAAADAAALVKSTAEATATALNIQYIQRDIVEIKQSLKDMSGSFVRTEDFSENEKKQVDHEARIRALEVFMNTLIGKMAVIAVGCSVLVSLLFIGIQYFLSKH